MRSIQIAALTAAALTLSVVSAPPGTTTPSTPVTPAATTPDTMSQDALPTVQVNGIVWGQVTVGNTVYAVGDFSSARPAGAASGVQETPRGNIVAYDVRTGVMDPSFVHTLNAQALTVTATPDGSRIYVGGQFTQVDGQNRYRIAAFATSSGALLPYAPSTNATVAAIAATNSVVYFGGIFSSVNGNARGRLAATNASGQLLVWAPSASSTVRAIVAAPDRSKVYLGGSFSSVNGQATSGVSAVDPVSGASITVPVSSQILASYDNSNSAGIFSLRTDGTLVYGAGFNAYSARYPQFEGTFALDPGSGRVQWVNDCWGDSYDATPVGGALYVASHAHNCRAAGMFPEYSPVHYFGLAYGLAASVDHDVRDARGWDYSAFHTSSLVQWNPTFDGGSVAGQSVWSFTGNADFVAAGGEFPRVNGVAQQGLVRFARHGLAPNRFGPSQIGTASARQIGVTSGVTVTAQTAWDPDDGHLTYQLIRDGGTANPVDAATAPTVGFWKVGARPTVTLFDARAPAGTHTYAVRAVDSGGNAVTGTSVSLTMTGANVALGRTATQSSTSAGLDASRAVDGTTDGYLVHGSVTQTGADPNSWWQVDLGHAVALTTIDVYNRTDCCADRLADYWVFVSSTPFDSTLSPTRQAARTEVWSRHVTGQAGSPTTLDAPVVGRYVMIQQNTSHQALGLAEVHANGPPAAFVPDLALMRPATQSSTYLGYGASRADDGDPTTFDVTAGTHDWWLVDLGSAHALESIAVFNRADCCAQRLTDWYVFVSATPFDTSLTPAQQAARPGVWTSHRTSPASFPTTIATPASGRYVMIRQNTGTEPLNLGEVQVFAR